jgi:hypothetical protein
LNSNVTKVAVAALSVVALSLGVAGLANVRSGRTHSAPAGTPSPGGVASEGPLSSSPVPASASPSGFTSATPSPQDIRSESDCIDQRSTPAPAADAASVARGSSVAEAIANVAAAPSIKDGTSADASKSPAVSSSPEASSPSFVLVRMNDDGSVFSGRLEWKFTYAGLNLPIPVGGPGDSSTVIFHSVVIYVDANSTATVPDIVQYSC